MGSSCSNTTEDIVKNNKTNKSNNREGSSRNSPKKDNRGDKV